VLKVEKLFIVPSLLAEPLSLKIGAVSPSPHLHQEIGLNEEMSFGTPPLYIVDAFALWSVLNNAISSSLPFVNWLVFAFLLPIQKLL
jgi:hypothetical protein